MESQFGMSEAIGGCNCSNGGDKKPSKYSLFVKKHFKSLKKEYPNKSPQEIMKLLGKKWQQSKK